MNKFLLVSLILPLSSLYAMEGQWAQPSGTKRAHDEEQEQDEPSKRPRCGKVSEEVVEVIQNLLRTSGASERMLTAALVDSVKSGDIKAVDVLVENGAGICFCDEDGDNLLHYAAAQGNYEMCECLLNQDIHGELYDDMVNKKDETPIAVAVKNGHLKVTKLLVRWKISMDFYEKGEMLSLRYAIKRGSIELVEALMKHECMDESMQVDEYTDIIRLALDWGRYSIAAFLIKKSPDSERLLKIALIRMANRANEGGFNYLVTHLDGDPNQMFQGGITLQQRLRNAIALAAQKADSKS